MQVQNERQVQHRASFAYEEERWYAAYSRANHKRGLPSS